MTLYALKPRFQAHLRGIAERAFRAGISANQVTVGAAAGSVALGIVLADFGRTNTWLFVLLPLWLFVRMALNAIDGMLARDWGQKSRLGAYLNEIADVVSDAALVLPFAMIPPFSPIGIGIIVVLAALTEFAGVMGPMVGASRRYDGPLGKSDRAFVFGALGLLLAMAGGLPAWAWWIVPILALLLALTVVNRVRGGLSEASGG